MLRFNFLLFIFLSATCAFKVMQYNLWRYGTSSLSSGQIEKIASHIKAVNPDIVAVQQYLNGETMSSFIKYLGSGWSGLMGCQNHSGVITRHKILELYEHTKTGMNARIRLNDSGIEVSVWSMNLNANDHGPYEAVKGNATTLDKILAGDRQKRIFEIIELINHDEFVQQIKNADRVPVIVAGTFHTPSHLDWTEATKGMHHGWVVDWPVTKLLSRAAGMTDSFREVHPDPEANPGFTWINNYEYTGKVPNDRIDYVFYRGSLRPTSSQAYKGNSANYTDDSKNTQWPTKRWAVITEFEHTPYKYENKPSFFIGSEFSKDSKAVARGPIKKCPLNIIH